MFLLCFLLLPVPVCAQCSQLALEANPFRGTLSYARQSAPGWHVGMEVGFGFPQIDRTLFPEEGDFFDLFHLGPFLRFSPSEHASVDLGLRLGVADLHECGASDCWPGLYAGASAAFMVGWRSFRIGPRVTAGWIRESGEPTTGFVSLAPVNLLVLYSW
jgi:hypothetical protein